MGTISGPSGTINGRRQPSRTFAGTVHRTGRDDTRPAGTVPAPRTISLVPAGTGPADRAAETTTVPGATGATGLGERATAVDIRTVAHLIPAARAARATLRREDRSLSRDNLADAMRADGHGVSNARASLLLKLVKAERDTTAFTPTPTLVGEDPVGRPEAA